MFAPARRGQDEHIAKFSIVAVGSGTEAGVDTMCFDKTGTLTEGRLRLVALADLDEDGPTEQAGESAATRRLLRAAARACPNPEDGPLVHATDRAAVEAADAHLGARPPTFGIRSRRSRSRVSAAMPQLSATPPITCVMTPGVNRFFGGVPLGPWPGPS
ncbi:hypothetical protein [Nocardia pseudobrasiliensis]|uniref:P-type E1-E2 ATPase n=1 Tax=Nocardia pseudobrasiliensis TaxID=45979 RepID=A0A370HQ40_9NOCA|nr:hypothetical protein [Nocardia pseudobrasiliensis]RDI59014.1 hypothetical protein DFR76_12013 [Nocardia pseudobrasiliensis]